MNDPQELYQIYAKWTGQLHSWVDSRLGRHIDCEYFPDKYEFKVYSGWAGKGPLEIVGGGIGISTVPNLQRPTGERSATIVLPRPENDPTQAELDNVFRALCLAAAQVLELDLGKPRLPDSPSPKKHASLAPAKKRLNDRKKPYE